MHLSCKHSRVAFRNLAGAGESLRTIVLIVNFLCDLLQVLHVGTKTFKINQWLYVNQCTINGDTYCVQSVTKSLISMTGLYF